MACTALAGSIPDTRSKRRHESPPAAATDRLALIASDHVRYTPETACRDGITYLVLEPSDLMARVAPLVPPSRAHLKRYYGVFAPHSRLQAASTPARRGMGAPKPSVAASEAGKPSPPRHVAIS